MTKERWVINGGRKFARVVDPSDREDVKRAQYEAAFMRVTLDNLVAERGPPSSVITGGAPGADTVGDEWRVSRNLPGTVLRADWAALGRRAGIARNLNMRDVAKALKGFTPVLISFPGGTGTAHMVGIATVAGFEIIRPVP